MEQNLFSVNYFPETFGANTNLQRINAITLSRRLFSPVAKILIPVLVFTLDVTSRITSSQTYLTE